MSKTINKVFIIIEVVLFVSRVPHVLPSNTESAHLSFSSRSLGVLNKAIYMTKDGA